MTLAEYERLQAEHAARGEFPEICCRIDDLPAAPAGILRALFRLGGPDPELEIE